MKIRELYIDAICYEEVSLAHYIHHLLQEGMVSLEDDESKLDLNAADHAKVREMIEQNVLIRVPDPQRGNALLCWGSGVFYSTIFG